jgi:hypothetical protein
VGCGFDLAGWYQSFHYAKFFIKKKFSHDIENLTKHSILLKEVGKQKKLMTFF